MEKILAALKTMPEYAALVDGLSRGESAAVTGLGQINRSHLLAGVFRELDRPMVLICQDDSAARRLQQELSFFPAGS